MSPRGFARVSTAVVLAGLALAAPAVRAQSRVHPPKASPPAPAPVPPPVSLGDSMDTVVRVCGAPLGVINRGGQTAMMYRDGEIEVRDGKVSRIRWKGRVLSTAAKPVELARGTAGEITFRRAAPNAGEQRTIAARKAEDTRLREANTRIKVVSTHETNMVRRVESPAPPARP